MLNRHLPAWFCCAALALAGAAYADPPHADLRPMTGPFQDWSLSCTEVCAIETEVKGADGSAVLHLSANADVLALSTALPLFLPDGVALALGDRPEWQVAWRSCAAGVCEARLALEGELLRALRRETGGAVSLTLLDGVRVRVPVSLLGFSRARKALAATPP